MNQPFYNFDKIKKFIGCDWVKSSNGKLRVAVGRNPKTTIIDCDIHKLPFRECSFDTVIDTFGLECSYDVERAWSEIKKLTKPNGKILLLERGLSYWMMDNLKLVAKASVNLGARGQVYHHDYVSLIENDPDVIVVKRKRKQNGMLYYYELRKKDVSQEEK